jgi:hypothetical protein
MDSSTLTVQVPKDLAAWLKEHSEESRMSTDDYVSLLLSVARARHIAGSPFKELAGSIKGTPPDLSTRKPFQNYK